MTYDNLWRMNDFEVVEERKFRNKLIVYSDWDEDTGLYGQVQSFPRTITNQIVYLDHDYFYLPDRFVLDDEDGEDMVFDTENPDNYGILYEDAKLEVYDSKGLLVETIQLEPTFDPWNRWNDKYLLETLESWLEQKATNCNSLLAYVLDPYIS